MSALDDAIQAIRMGDREEGRRLLEEILETDESNENVWLWLSSVVDSDEDREVCLENVLAINPDNAIAQQSMDALRSGNFNINKMMSDMLDEQEEASSGSTFLDEFQVGDDADAEDEEFELPSTMAKDKSKKKKQAASAKKGLPNIRIILLVAFVVIVVLALGGIAAFKIIGSRGRGTAPGAQPGQQGGPPPTETPTPPPTSTPTNTPTPTYTPFLLPTSKPTEPPTPTATPVVPPTLVK